MRTKPYSDVAKTKCTRCGRRAAHQWEGPCAARAFAGKTVYIPLCTPCDVEPNRISLTFVYGADIAGDMLNAYEA